MNKEEFVLLQQQYQQSGKSLKDFLKDTGICYFKYNYWNKKCKSDDAPHELAPITLTIILSYQIIFLVLLIERAKQRTNREVENQPLQAL